MNDKTASKPGSNLSYLLYFSIGSIILFLPVLTKNFVSDDYVVLKRVCLEHSVIVEGFFRPLSDITIYLNYKILGFSPLAFNLVNIFIHTLNSFLVFRLMLKWKWTSNFQVQKNFALIAATLFLSYPFHSEAIVWLLGRGASLAATFMLLALIAFSSSWTKNRKIFAVCVCYFVGLLAYESIVILPLVIFILLAADKRFKPNYINWASAFFVTIVAHLLLRYKFSGALFGHYGENIVANSWLNYPANILKVLSRLMVPPVSNSLFFLTVAASMAVVAGTIFYRVYREADKRSLAKPLLTMLLGAMACTLLIPFVVGVSTRTSESDRLLYLPSIFLCCLTALLLSKWIQSNQTRLIIFVALCVCQVIFLEVNNYNWYRAGKATGKILNMIGDERKGDKIFIVNLPNEINGAYVFREGFKDAMVINQLDTSRVKVINRLSKELKGNGTWTPLHRANSIFIPPFVEMHNRASDMRDVSQTGIIQVAIPPGSRVIFWNQEEWLLLDNHQAMLNTN